MQTKNLQQYTQKKRKELKPNTKENQQTKRKMIKRRKEHITKK